MDIRAAAAAPGERIYAIGDVHGRLDLLAELLAIIRADSEMRPPARRTVVQLGDFIDRGPDSAALIQTFMTFTAQTDQIIVLKGNHEAAMIDAMRGELQVARHWLRMGGDQTLRSWGVEEALIADNDVASLMRAARQIVPTAAVSWMERLPTSYSSGDYLFVHAGIRPGVDLRAQQPEDLLWIREDFIDSDVDHGMLIVHGHSIAQEPDLRHNRIGIDTGAYRTGRLTALGVEASERWILATGMDH